MARAIKFTENYGQVLTVIPPENGKGKGKKEYVGGFKKGDIWDKCSAQLAQKLVNRLGVAEYVKDRVGDDAAQKVAGVNKVIEKASAEADKIKADAQVEADKIKADAQVEADKIKAEAGKKDGELT